MSSSDADLAFSTTSGAGLSLDRIRINYQGNGTSTPETQTALLAQARGAKVWATPWTPPTADKSNTNSVEGTLTNASAYATFLVNYVAAMKSAGVDLYAISAQNEPDANVTYESCVYTPSTMATFVANTLGPAFAGSSVKVMAPETQNACGFTSYFSAIQSNTAAWNAVGIFASHEYGCGTLPSEPSIAAASKEYWETEVDTGAASGDSPGDGIASALLTATTMHNDLTKANLNAWHYWWLYCSNNSGCLYDTGTKVWTKRLWAMGNFSRFVRPGWKRVATSGTAPSGVLVSAYINPANSALSIVAINNNTSSKTASFFISSNAPCSLTPYETSASKSLGQGAAMTVSQSRVTVTLTAQSVTTFVGTP